MTRPLSRTKLVIIEVVVWRPQRNGAVDFERTLAKRVSLFDKPELHLPDALLGGIEGRQKHGVLYEGIPMRIAMRSARRRPLIRRMRQGSKVGTIRAIRGAHQ